MIMMHRISRDLGDLGRNADLNKVVLNSVSVMVGLELGSELGSCKFWEPAYLI